MIRRLDRALRRWGWPPFHECQDCAGTRDWGCECGAHGSIWSAALELPADRWFWRWLHGFLFINTSPFWTDPLVGLD